MQRVLVTIQYNEVTASMPDWGCLLAKLTQGKLTGVFLNNVQLLEIPDFEPLPQKLSGKPAKAKRK